MQTIRWMILLILLLCSGCSSVVIKDAETVRMEYWEKEGMKKLGEEEILDDSNGLIVFENAVNTAEEVKPQSIVTTRPQLTMEFEFEKAENRKYHVWVNEQGDGFLQSLYPQESITYQMDSDAAEELKEFLATNDQVEIIQGEIEFEN